VTSPYIVGKQDRRQKAGQTKRLNDDLGIETL
jgi:hypothetical protein